MKKYLNICFLIIGLTIISCETKTGTGALAGGALGAGAGALIGGGEGALIGGAVGAIGGGLVGAALDEQDRKIMERKRKALIDGYRLLEIIDTKLRNAEGELNSPDMENDRAGVVLLLSYMNGLNWVRGAVELEIVNDSTIVEEGTSKL